MRTSSRRRVMPRASSRVASGTAYLRLVPSASRRSLMVKPSGCAASRRARRRSRLVDGGPGEPDPVLLHDQAPTGQLPQLGGVDAVRRGWGEGRRRAPPGTGGRPAGSTASAGRARPPSTVMSASVSSTARSRSSRRATSRPSSPAAPICSASADTGGGQHLGVHDPGPRRRGPPLAGQPLQLVDPDPAPLGHDPVHRPVRRGAGGRQHRVDVEDLAAAHGLAPARTRAARSGRPGTSGRAWRRCRRTRPALPGLDAVGAQHPEAHDLLAGADVGHVGPAPRHPVARGRRARAGRRRPRGRRATGRPGPRPGPGRRRRAPPRRG